MYDANFVAKSESSYPHFTRTFTGQVLDAETGLLLYRNRVYHPTLGRFIQRDPIGYKAEDVNLYRYVGNQATHRLDFDGLQWGKYPWPTVPDEYLGNSPSEPKQGCGCHEQQIITCIEACDILYKYLKKKNKGKGIDRGGIAVVKNPPTWEEVFCTCGFNRQAFSGIDGIAREILEQCVHLHEHTHIVDAHNDWIAYRPSTDCERIRTPFKTSLR